MIVARRTHVRKMAQRLVRLHEGAITSGSTVDRELGIIYGVKILGRTSPNNHGVDGVDGTEYTLEAMQKAAPLYEGINVNVNHPPREKPNQDRDANDRYAWLENVQVRESGMYGDLHFLDPADKLAVKMMTAAEQHPKAFGLSHNAYGKGEIRGKKYVIVEIPEVRSVDIVADAGSVTGLFESKRNKERRPMKIKDYLKACIPLIESKARKPILVKLLEECHDDMEKIMEQDMPPLDDGTDAVPPEPDVGADQALKDGFRAAMLAVLDDDTMDAKAKLDKLKQLLTTHEKLTTAPEPEPDLISEAEEEAEEEDQTEPDADDKKIEESRALAAKADLKHLREELKIRDLVEAAELKFGKPDARAAFIGSLIPLTESQRKLLIDERKAFVSPLNGNKPRSQSPGRPLTESKAAEVAVSDGKTLAQALRR